MSYCSALLKSEKYCSAKAKYILKQYSQPYCGIHALSHSNQKMNTNYETIAEVPSLEMLVDQVVVSEDSIGEILSDIYHKHNHRVTVLSKKKVKTGEELVVADLDNLSDKYLLRVAKTSTHIDQAIGTSSIYASLVSRLTTPMCVPIISYTQDGHGTCLIRGWRYGYWYYEMVLLTHPVLMSDLPKLVTTLSNLIKWSHQYRIVYGSIELRNLTQLKAKRISTTVFESLKNAMFWEGRYGQTVECDTPIDSDISFDSQICAKRMNQKLHPCRYDDYESLLYLTLQLLGDQLPWTGLIIGSDIAIEKNNFLRHHAGLTSRTAIGEISTLLLDSHFDDRPDYSKLMIHFMALVE
jgi:hypothetical protein